MTNVTALRLLPKVDEILRKEEIGRLGESVPRLVLLHAVQQVIESLRESILKGGMGEDKLRKIVEGKDFVTRVRAQVEEFERSCVVRAVNATGVVLHTGLGRAPLARAAAAAAEAAAGYSLLEIDRKTGDRGLRDGGVERMFRLLFSCDAGAAVNNNAAATLLAVHTFAKGKEAIVSRGELVEIGGSYRMPDVMKAGGAKLVEVGTTNRTRLSDYRSAITKKTGLILKVHTSNFRIEGFSEEASLEELAALGKESGIPFVHDLGSGLLLSGKMEGLEGLAREPRVIESLRAGVDLVTFSGDKLLGGPQCGVLLGKKESIAKIRKNPMFRAMRLGKQALSALEATLHLYLQGEETAQKEIPSLRMLGMSREEIGKKAEALARGIRSLGISGLSVEIEDDFSEVGSGSAPGTKLPTRVVVLSHEKWKPAQLAMILRCSSPAVFSRVRENKVALDPRTLLEGDESFIISALSKCFSEEKKD